MKSTLAILLCLCAGCSVLQNGLQVHTDSEKNRADLDKENLVITNRLGTTGLDEGLHDVKPK